MIVSCPNCSARYRMADASIAAGARLRCAGCHHRWRPADTADTAASTAAQADEEADFAAVQDEISERWRDGAAPLTVPPVPAPVVNAADTAPVPIAADREIDGTPDANEPETPPSKLGRSLVAGLAGLVLAVVAAGMWADRIDLRALPLARRVLPLPAPKPALEVTAKGLVTVLPSGGRVLEINGTIRNPGPGDADVALLVARLSGPRGTALRWTITPDARVLRSGQSLAYASIATGFPADATRLQVSLAR